MPTDQKQTELSPEEIEKKRKAVINEYKNKPYWTFKEGKNLLSKGFFLLRESSPAKHPTHIDEAAFDNIIRDLEMGNVDTITSVKELEKQIYEYREYCNYVKKKERKSHYSAHDHLILWDLQDKLFDSIKIKPFLFIEYVKKNLDRFSGIEIPSEFLSLLNEMDKKKIEKPENNISLEKQLYKLIEKLTPEIDQFYETVKTIAKKDNRNAQDLRYEDGIEAFEQKKDVSEILESDDIQKSFFGGEKPARDIKGGILRKIVIRKNPKLIKNGEGIIIDSQTLYSRMLKIRKQPKN